ncbi:MAG: class I SAM-dependent methyltransferase [Bacteriovoracaceae bacterium]|jgi:SAM-dependent methyltransferase|nr:class I SAM-dependent methyltransferase [Bacteriovoracaceae bacterium]
MGKKKQKLREYNKYWYYEKSVQNPEGEVDFFNEKYGEIRGKQAFTLREDFCGTGAISCKWAAQSENHKSYGIDLDPEPIAYGKEVHYAALDDEAKTRMEYLEANVLDSPTPKVDITFAFNFSYFIFKKRVDLLNYFKAAYESLNDTGVFFIDIFGGPDSIQENEDIIEHSHYDYHWECQKFNPMNNECRFAIHFKRDGEKRRANQFVYEWRMWGIMEIRDLLEEAGFKKTIAYWEEDDEDGDGNGNFYPSEDEEQCESWVTYIGAVK